MPDPVSGGAVASGVGGLVGGISGLFGGKKTDSGAAAARAAVQAAQIQADSANRSADLQYKMYQEAVGREQPWITAGTGAVNQYSGLLNLPGYAKIDPTGYLRSTPGYDWQLGQGVNALDRSAASRGMLLSGPQAKAVTKYGQGLADTTYNSLMDRLYGLSNQGQSAASLAGNQGMTTGQNMGNAYMSGANAQAQGLYNAYNARESAYQNQQNNMMGGLGMLTNSLGKFGSAVAPAVSNWWGGGSSNPGGYVSSEPNYSANPGNYYSSGTTPAGYPEFYY